MRNRTAKAARNRAEARTHFAKIDSRDEEFITYRINGKRWNEMRRKPLSIAFRVTEEQHKMINEKAKNSNLSKTDFIVKCCFDKEIIIVNDVRELMKELLSVGNNLTQLTTRAKLMNLEVVDLKPTYMKLVEIYTVLTELMNRVKN